MFTLLFGVLLVVGSAVGFGLALFGRRPIPQPAMTGAAASPGAGLAETRPSSLRAAARSASGPTHDDAPEEQGDGLTTKAVPRWQRLLQRDQTAERVDASDVTLSGWVRVRSSLLLALTVAGLAALLGVVASVLVVGIVLLVT